MNTVSLWKKWRRRLVLVFRLLKANQNAFVLFSHIIFSSCEFTFVIVKFSERKKTKWNHLKATILFRLFFWWIFTMLEEFCIKDFESWKIWIAFFWIYSVDFNLNCRLSDLFQFDILTKSKAFGTKSKIAMNIGFSFHWISS